MARPGKAWQRAAREPLRSPNDTNFTVLLRCTCFSAVLASPLYLLHSLLLSALLSNCRRVLQTSQHIATHDACRKKDLVILPRTRRSCCCRTRLTTRQYRGSRSRHCIHEICVDRLRQSRRQRTSQAGFTFGLDLFRCRNCRVSSKVSRERLLAKNERKVLQRNIVINGALKVRAKTAKLRKLKLRHCKTQGNIRQRCLTLPVTLSLTLSLSQWRK